MNIGIQKLKKRQLTLRNAIRRALSYDEEFPKNSQYAARIAESVKATQTGKVMEECAAGGSRCGSVFCDTCKKKKQSSLYSAYRLRFDESLSGDEVIARDRLRWVTVLHSVVVIFDQANMQEIMTIEDVKSAVEAMKKDLANVARTAKRKHGVNIWLRGGVHIELVDYEMYRLAGKFGKMTTKEETLKTLLHELDPSVSGKLFLVHFHALADTAGLSDKKFRNLFSEKWKLKRQVLIKRLWSKIKKRDSTVDHKLDDALRGMARYCFNGSNARLAYSMNWGAGSVVLETGEEVGVDGKITTYAREIQSYRCDKKLSVGELRLLIEIHNQVNSISHKGLGIGIY